MGVEAHFCKIHPEIEPPSPPLLESSKLETVNVLGVDFLPDETRPLTGFSAVRDREPTLME